MVRNIEEAITQQAAPGVLGIDWWTVKDSYFDNNVTWMNQKRFDVSCVKGSVRHVFVALAITIEENSLPLTSLSLVFSPVFYPAITLLFLFSVTHLPKTLTRLRCRSPTTGHFLKHTHTHTRMFLLGLNLLIVAENWCVWRWWHISQGQAERNGPEWLHSRAHHMNCVCVNQLMSHDLLCSHYS